ncbi:MAG: universal stress protein [Gammaproteobacteria bacterium]
MSIRTILLPLRESDTSKELLESAAAAAKRLNAHLTVLHVRPRADEVIPFATLALSASMKANVIEATEQGASETAQRLHAEYAAVIAQTGLPERDLGMEPESASVEWCEVAGRRDVMSARFGRLADLIIVPKPSRMAPVPATFEAALRDTGRPMLMLPRRTVWPLRNEHAAIGWNGSAAASKALQASMPLLHAANNVTILVTEKRTRTRPDANDVTRYLSCHGVSATARIFDPSGKTVGETLLAQCDEIGADLLVVGGYSRSRISEVMLGGVTRFLMANADRPVLLCH